MSCTRPTNCVAVGFQMYTSADMKTLVKAWDGSAWSLTANPNPAAEQELLGVACTARSSCEAVGYHGGAGSVSSYKTLVETGR